MVEDPRHQLPPQRRSSCTIPSPCRCSAETARRAALRRREIYQRDLDYLKYNSPYCQYPYVSLYTGRGCPARCTFCLWPQVTTGHSYRTRSPENVFEEVKEMQRRFPQMKEIFFDDDTFTADPPRARKLAEMFKPLGLCWSTNSRANVDRETLRVMKEGGLRLFVVGYESGNEQILKNIKKGVSVERARRFTKDCHELGILIHGTFIVGLPGETLQTIEESIRFAQEMNPETIQVSLASPYPGTHFYEYVKEHDVVVQDVYNDEAGYQKCTVSYPEARPKRSSRRSSASTSATTSGRDTSRRRSSRSSSIRTSGRGCSPRAGSS